MVEARRVEGELSKSDDKTDESKERSARSLLRSLVSRIAANDPADLAADMARFLDLMHRHCSDTRAKRQSLMPSMHPTKAGGDVQYTDVLVSTKDEDFFVDFLVTAPNNTNAKEASQ